MKTKLKLVTKRILSTFGLEIRRINRSKKPHSTGYGGNQWDFSVLQSSLLKPDLVVDVGVAWGTPELYSAFPDAKLFLIEPITDFNARIKELVGKRDFVLKNIAAGKEQGTLCIHFNRERPHQSSLHQRTLHDGTTREVKVSPIDDIVRGEKAERLILKIDVEGAEIEALMGASETLSRSVCVFVEVNMGYMFAEKRNPLPQVNRLLAAKGFTLFRVMDAAILKSEGLMQVCKVDLCYVRD